MEAIPPLTHAPHVFVDDLDAPELSPEDRRHLEVLRIRPGDDLVVGDGAGAWRLVGYGPQLVARTARARTAAPTPPIALAFALTKADKPELTVQKLTELGADRIIVCHAERSVARWEGVRATRHLDRLRKVAREAAMQSRRLHLPVIEGVESFTALARREAVVVAERGGAAPTLDPCARGAVVAIGPEGGFTATERELAAGEISLGTTVLRAETAALAAAALLAGLRAKLVDPAGG